MHWTKQLDVLHENMTNKLSNGYILKKNTPINSNYCLTHSTTPQFPNNLPLSPLNVGDHHFENGPRTKYNIKRRSGGGGGEYGEHKKNPEHSPFAAER